jgi:hypothetical protein
MRRHLVALVPTLLLWTAQASIAQDPVTLGIETPRRAFYRGEEILLNVRCTNGSDAPVTGALSVTLGDGLTDAREVAVPAGGGTNAAFRLTTHVLKVGQYTLDIALTTEAGLTAELQEQILLAKRPHPDRLMVWLWGGSGSQWYLDHGFTTWSRPSLKDPARAADILDRGLAAGAECAVWMNGGLREIDTTELSAPDAVNKGVYSWHEKPLANPLHPEVARIQNDTNEATMLFLKDFPQMRTVFFNTEVVDALAPNRNEAGIRMIRETLGFSDADIDLVNTITKYGKWQWWPPEYVAPCVISDTDKSYLFRKYAYKQGNGLAAANQRVVDMVKRYRPDILTITDPYREAAMYDMFPGLDIVSTWTYTNPDPKMMLYIETLRAAVKPTGQITLHTVTLLNYPGALMPTEEWTLMGPGRLKVTTWINLSRAPRMLGYYYSSECNPANVDTPRVPYGTTLALKELSDRVFKPYGPMLTNLDVAPRKIAVLSSDAARLYGTSPGLLGSYNNLQIYNFYSVMAMAHLQADVIFDETIERFGLDAYEVLVLPKCDVLTKSGYDAILRFQRRGGVVIADQYLGPEIPNVLSFGFDFTYRKKVNANAIAKNTAFAEWNDHLQPGSAELETVEGVTALDDQRIMESYAQVLKQGLAGVVEPEVDSDSPTVLLNMLEKHGAKYLVVVNDKRAYDDRVGEHKAVLGKVEPQSATLTLKQWGHPELHAYDMLNRQPLAVEKVGKGYRFPVDLSTLGGTMVALYPAQLESVKVRTHETMHAGLPHAIAVDLTDSRGTPPMGLQPVQVTITDPDGEISASSDYYCAENGRLTVDFTPAVNDVRGRWTVSVTDLTAGLEAEAGFEVVD